MKKLVLLIVIIAGLTLVSGAWILSTAGESSKLDPDMPVISDLSVQWNSGKMELSWEKPDADISGYEIWHSSQSNKDSDYELAERIEGPDATSYSDPGATESVVDFYKIRTYKNEKKFGLFKLISYSDFSSGINSVEIAEQIPIISYHQLCDGDLYNQISEYKTLYVADNDFDEQMKWLKDNGWRTLSNAEMAAWHSGEIELPHKSTMITFDDGNYSVIKYGLPILEKYGQKATTFIIGSKTKAVTDKECYDVYKYGAIGEDVIKEVRESYPDFEFQSHTYSMHDRIDGHKPINILSKEGMAEDLAVMNEKFGCNSIAYPWGKYNDDLYSAIEENGNYIIGYTYGSNHYAKRSQRRFALKRIKIKGGRPMEKFIRWYDGSMDNID